MKDFSFFFQFLKNGSNDFLKKLVYLLSVKLKLSRGYKKYKKISDKIEKTEVEVCVRKNVHPLRFATISLNAKKFET